MNFVNIKLVEQQLREIIKNCVTKERNKGYKNETKLNTKKNNKNNLFSYKLWLFY